MSRTALIELYEYDELDEYSQKRASVQLQEKWDDKIKTMDTLEIMEYCSHYGIEFRENGDIF